MSEFMLRDLNGLRIDVVSPVSVDPDDYAGLDMAVELIVDTKTVTLNRDQTRTLALALVEASLEA